MSWKTNKTSEQKKNTWKHNQKSENHCSIIAQNHDSGHRINEK